MYIDLSLRKVGILILIACMLFLSITLTFDAKDHQYGSTPAFTAAHLTIKENWLRIRYAFESGVWKLFQTASVASAFITGGDASAKSVSMARAIPVLTYHRIAGGQNDQNNVTESRFRDQITTLARAGWKSITLKEYRAFMAGDIELPEKSFLITFDDGAKESFYPVDPLFSALGYTGVLYVIASSMYTPESTYYLSPNEISRMLKTGRWEIGSHSLDGHRPYPTDAKGTPGIFFADKLWNAETGRLETSREFTDRVHNDLAQARETLESEYGIPIETFAFPLGNETRIEGAANFREGAMITEQEAKKLYALGFLQTNPHRYSFNYPNETSFLAYRIHVDHDWDGKRLLQELENGLPKNLPFEDDFSKNRGWISAWGKLDLGKNNLELTADENASSASTFLDGSRLWDSYSFNANLNWMNGSIFLLADVENSKTYTACVFSDGKVSIQSTISGETRILQEREDARITNGEGVQAGIRVRDSVIECLWNFESISEVYDRNSFGGIGIQVWNPNLGTAHLTVSEIIVRPF